MVGNLQRPSFLFSPSDSAGCSREAKLPGGPTYLKLGVRAFEISTEQPTGFGPPVGPSCPASRNPSAPFTTLKTYLLAGLAVQSAGQTIDMRGTKLPKSGHRLAGRSQSCGEAIEAYINSRMLVGQALLAEAEAAMASLPVWSEPAVVRGETDLRVMVQRLPLRLRLFHEGDDAGRRPEALVLAGRALPGSGGGGIGSHWRGCLAPAPEANSAPARASCKL
ncbi:hypothetical protein BDY21DRAFT_364063 [Lineolata rhizophorae]|uniref:Uncharacterized protein n=1 Tax=Lineolata rhizophorae TaxID=578093 RepID=A0A6A6P0Z7_9PEZI|nr:hypothetical protein BDY21DRAFT_364063 [Lineolata rhizophorae]